MDAEQRAEIRGAFALNGFPNEMIPVGQSTGVMREYRFPAVGGERSNKAALYADDLLVY